MLDDYVILDLYVSESWTYLYQMIKRMEVTDTTAYRIMLDVNIGVLRKMAKMETYTQYQEEVAEIK